MPDTAIDKVTEMYGHSQRNKYRAVVCYLRCIHFGKQDVHA